MTEVPKMVPVTHLRRDAAGVLRDLHGSGQPLIITQRGQAVGILLSIDAYNRSQRENDLLHLVAMGEKEIALGKGYSLESVLKDADTSLKDCSPHTDE